MPSTDLKNALRRLIDYRVAADVAEKKAKAAKEKRDNQERLVLELLEDAGMGVGEGSLTMNLGEGYGKVQFVANRTIFSKVFREDDLRAWAEQEGRVEEFFKEGVRKAPLNQLIRDVLDDQDGGQELPPGVDFSQKEYVTVTRR